MSDELIIKDKGADFERETPPAGPISAVCFRVFNIGAQMTKFGVKQEICIVWEIDFRYSTGDLKGKRFMLKQRYTANMGQKSNLRKMLQSWQGRAFDSTELKIKGFDVKKIEGRTALINIVHSQKEDITYANVGVVMPLPSTYAPMKVEAPADFVPKYIQGLLDKQVVSEVSASDTVLVERGFDGEKPPTREPTKEETEIF